MITSAAKIRANRANGRKSRGPRTLDGKLKSSLNACRHSLAATKYRRSPPPEKLQAFAKAFCGQDADPELFETAIAIACDEFLLRAISDQQAAVFERLRDPTLIPLAKGNNSLELAKERFRRSELTLAEGQALRDRLWEKHKDELPPIQPEHRPLVPAELILVLLEKEEQDEFKQPVEETPDEPVVAPSLGERDETTTLEAAAVDLVRLERYENRARQRQRKAIDKFITRKFALWGDRKRTRPPRRNAFLADTCDVYEWKVSPEKPVSKYRIDDRVGRALEEAKRWRIVKRRHHPHKDLRREPHELLRPPTRTRRSSAATA